MTKTDAYFKATEAKLSVKDSKKLLKTLKDLRVSGKASVIPLIINQLETQKDDKITKEIISLLGQLKDEEARPFIIQGIKSSIAASNTKKTLIMTCWQSGLDYSKYLIDFAEEFIKGDYLVAIEAFSVIEEWIHNSPKEANEICKKHLIDQVSEIKEEKKALYHELVKLFESHI